MGTQSFKECKQIAEFIEVLKELFKNASSYFEAIEDPDLDFEYKDQMLKEAVSVFTNDLH